MSGAQRRLQISAERLQRFLSLFIQVATSACDAPLAAGRFRREVLRAQKDLLATRLHRHDDGLQRRRRLRRHLQK